MQVNVNTSISVADEKSSSTSDIVNSEVTVGVIFGSVTVTA